MPSDDDPSAFVDRPTRIPSVSSMLPSISSMFKRGSHVKKIKSPLSDEDYNHISFLILQTTGYNVPVKKIKNIDEDYLDGIENKFNRIENLKQFILDELNPDLRHLKNLKNDLDNRGKSKTRMVTVIGINGKKTPQNISLGGKIRISKKYKKSRKHRRKSRKKRR